MRKLIRKVLYILFRILTRLTVTGVENIPAEGGCLVTGNHLGIIDGPLYYCLIPRDDAVGLVALKHRNNPVIRFIVETADGIWIDRTRTDFGALKKARAHLKNGGLLGIAPEGTRSDTHALIEAKPGVAFLADKSNATIVPLAGHRIREFLEEDVYLPAPCSPGPLWRTFPAATPRPERQGCIHETQHG